MGSGRQRRHRRSHRSRREERSERPCAHDGLVGIPEAWRKILEKLGQLKTLGARWHAERVALRARRHQRKPWRRTLSVAAVIFSSVFLLQLLLNVVEPFGLDNATKAHSARISARIMAPFYKSSAQEHIAVVLIDEATLRAREEPWPPRYDYYADVLRRIIRQRPRAVYVDIMTADRRAYDRSLDDARAALAEGLAEDPVPVWWGTVSPTVSSVFAEVPGVTLATAGWRGLGEAYPLTIAPANQLSDPPAAAAASAASPAWLLYQAACATRTPGCREAASRMGPLDAARPISLHWGASRPTAPARPLGRTGQCTADARPGTLARMGMALRAGWNSFRSGADDGRLDRVRERCPYTLTVYEDELDDPDVAALLSDRVVLVGGNLAAIDDSVVSPVHQRLPGVYMHAMALDNLMTWGTDRLHRRPRVAMATMAASGLLMALGIAYALRHAAGVRRRLILLAVALVGTLGTSAFLHGVMRQPPGDWLGMLGLFAIVFTAVRPSAPEPSPQGD